MAHQLTTRARFLADYRQRLLTLPPRPVPMVPAEERPAYRLATGLLRLVLTLLFLLVLGAALYPGSEPTRPLRVAEEVPASRTAWYGSDYTN